ncbi:hypothetical protein INO51_13990, partial [Staphylococcus aureus]|nr:hypothetical protein [Staphylococcus aureus]
HAVVILAARSVNRNPLEMASAAAAAAYNQNRRVPPTMQIQKILDENAQLISTIQEFQSKGKAQDCVQFQQILHRNLVYLA